VIPDYLDAPLNTLLILIEIVLLGFTFFVVIAKTIRATILHYQLGALALAVLTPLMAIVRSNASLDYAYLYILIPLLPLALVVLVHPLLARATLLTSRHRLRIDREEVREANRIWLKSSSNEQPRIRFRDVGAFILLVFFSFEIVNRINLSLFEEMQMNFQIIGLVAALSLYLIGLYNMLIKRDIISQVIGLLVMDQGLYLAMVDLVDLSIAGIFVVAFYFYTLITIFVMVLLLPRLRRATRSLELKEISGNSQLEG
jgi:hydrogenase-4 membrane subunit HyfE